MKQDATVENTSKKLRMVDNINYGKNEKYALRR